MFIHMTLTQTASCGQSSSMFSLHLWHMKPYGIIYPLGRDHFQTGRFSGTIISCGILDQNRQETKRVLCCLKGSCEEFSVFKSSFKLVPFLKKRVPFISNLNIRLLYGLLFSPPFLWWVIVVHEGYWFPLGLIRSSRQVHDLLEIILFRSDWCKPFLQTSGPTTGTQQPFLLKRPSLCTRNGVHSEPNLNTAYQHRIKGKQWQSRLTSWIQ